MLFRSWLCVWERVCPLGCDGPVCVCVLVCVCVCVFVCVCVCVCERGQPGVREGSLCVCEREYMRDWESVG